MPLTKKSDAGDYVDDFQKSKAPQFKGKSKKKKRQMAIAAYLSNKNELAEIIREVLNEEGIKEGFIYNKLNKVAKKAVQFFRGKGFTEKKEPKKAPKKVAKKKAN